MRALDMCDSEGKPCLLVAKRVSATGVTVGRANGIFLITSGSGKTKASDVTYATPWLLKRIRASGFPNY
jgi:hypothetical protein